ncbi:MAG: transketolase family protein [Candidatus Omnitrophica bacterium]|nr:transketolase family protein [Candidatus Omnitrophota bacterium]
MAHIAATRDGFGSEIVELGKSNNKILVLSADLEDATRAEFFRDAYPNRFFTVGIAEQDLVGTAAGLSMAGYIPFIASFAVFLTNRAYDMLRLDVCYNECNVKIVCSHYGVTVGEDGATAQCLEDLAILRVLPNMKVLCPADVIEARKATRLMAETPGPIYMRTSRAPFPIITKESDPFILGKANILRGGKDATVIACGGLVSEALNAADDLIQEGIDIRVVNMHTIKPIDAAMIEKCVSETGAIVTAEEHQRAGGLGSAVAEVAAQKCPVPMEIIAVDDQFGQSGSPEELLRHYHLKSPDIIAAVKRVIARKVK